MREFDALRDYPEPRAPRVFSDRNINSRIVASYRDEAFFDGERANGYGGLVDDGRWAPIAQLMVREYRLGVPDSLQGLEAPGRVLQLNCEKGFLLGELAKLGIPVCGTETSRYAGSKAPVRVEWAPPTALPFPDKSFDLVLAIGPVYTLTLGDAIKCLREIERVKRGHSFITLGAYETDEDFKLLRNWSLLGTTLLRKSEWLAVLEHAGYSGDYKFVTAESLGLRWG